MQVRKRIFKSERPSIRHQKVHSSVKEIYITKEKRITRNLLNNQNYMSKMYCVGNYVNKSLEERKKISTIVAIVIFSFSSVIILPPNIIIIILGILSLSFYFLIFLSVFLVIKYSKRYDKGYIRTSYKKDEIMKVEKKEVDNLSVNK